MDEDFRIQEESAQMRTRDKNIEYLLAIYYLITTLLEWYGLMKNLSIWIKSGIILIICICVIVIAIDLKIDWKQLTRTEKAWMICSLWIPFLWIGIVVLG